MCIDIFVWLVSRCTVLLLLRCMHILTISMCFYMLYMNWGDLNCWYGIYVPHAGGGVRGGARPVGPCTPPCSP